MLHVHQCQMKLTMVSSAGRTVFMRLPCGEDGRPFPVSSAWLCALFGYKRGDCFFFG